MLDKSNRQRAWRYVAISLGLASFACFGVAIYLILLYANTLPRVPQPELGRVYSLNNHGTVVYLTQRENFALIGLFIVSVALFTIFAWLTGAWRWRGNRSGQQTH
jgi:hypothetical protein